MADNEKRTIRVRIAVAVSENGDYSANGWRTRGEDAGDQAAGEAAAWSRAEDGLCSDSSSTDLQIRWVEADVPAYERVEPTVIGNVVEEVTK